MNKLLLFEDFFTETATSPSTVEEVATTCDELGIRNYSVNQGLAVDVGGNVATTQASLLKTM